MSSKYELISADRPSPGGKLLDGLEDCCKLSSWEGRGVTDGGPRVEPAIASFSSSFRDSKLCEWSNCGMPNKSWNTSEEKRYMFTHLLFTVNLLCLASKNSKNLACEQAHIWEHTCERQRANAKARHPAGRSLMRRRWQSRLRRSRTRPYHSCSIFALCRSHVCSQM